MPAKNKRLATARKTRLAEAVALLQELQFSGKQRNDTAAYTLLALLHLGPQETWSGAQSPLMGITPIIDFIADAYGLRYAPNTRETIRDEAVKFFTEAGLLLRNPDQPDRPTNSGKTVYQMEPSALALIRSFGTLEWHGALQTYLASVEAVKKELHRHRQMARQPVTLPDGQKVTLSPGGQNPLIAAIIEEFCPRYAPGGVVLYIGDTENKSAHLKTKELAALGIVLDAAAKVPDVIVHHVAKNWLLLIEAATTAGPVDGKRRMELKALFAGSTAGLVFVTAFESRRAMQSFFSTLAWETEVWLADAPEHMIHLNGERFLGPYPDAMPQS